MDLWALKTLRERIKAQNELKMNEMGADFIEEAKEPEVKIEKISRYGQVKLLFSQEMSIEAVFADILLTTSSTTHESSSEDQSRRLTQKVSLSLSNLIHTEVKRGAWNSAPASDL